MTSALQLGNRTAQPPVNVTGISDATAITAGFSHTCAVRSDSTIACWGRNSDGQLGREISPISTIPVIVFDL